MKLTKKILTSHKGRKCKSHGCKRILSIYNHDTHCHIHLNKLSGKTQWQNLDKQAPEYAKPAGILG